MSMKTGTLDDIDDAITALRRARQTVENNEAESARVITRKARIDVEEIETRLRNWEQKLYEEAINDGQEGRALI